MIEKQLNRRNRRRRVPELRSSSTISWQDPLAIEDKLPNCRRGPHDPLTSKWRQFGCGKGITKYLNKGFGLHIDQV